MNPARNPKQAVYEKRGFSYIWIVPLLAFLTVGWMAWSQWRDSGPVIHITFEKTEGVEANHTRIMHKGVVLGIVTALSPSADFSHVLVTAKMDSVAAPYLNNAAKFWVVHPRVSVGSISDLNTLVSGVYIELSPGEGAETRDFAGLEEPLAVDQREAGKSFVLHAPQLGSLERGSPLYFRGLPVGEVASLELGQDKSIVVHVFVRAPYDKLVLDQTRFWNVSGIGVTAGAEGFKIAAQSLQAVVQGGISFDVPNDIDGGSMAAANVSFPLYGDRDAAYDSIYTKKISYLLHFAGSVQGLDVGAPVDLLGNRIGHVSQTRIAVDEKTGQAISRITIEIEPERIHFDGGNNGEDVEQRARRAFAHMVKRNLRAQVASGNLLTGQKNINLAYIDDAAPAAIADANPYPEFPTAPSSDIASLLSDAHNVLQDSDKMIRAIEPQIQPLLSSLKTTADQINTNDGSGGLSGTLYELKQAARSVRALADDLDAHPESLLRGKKESGP